MLQYEIAGFKWKIANGRNYRFKRMKPFESVYNDRPDIEIEFRSSDNFPVRKYTATENRQDSIILDTEYNGDKTVTYIYMKEADELDYIIEADSNWSHVAIIHRKEDKKAQDAFCAYLGNFIISNKIILSDGIILHASSVEHEGKGIAFTAPSGTGKSTHTAMWVKYHNASIINDDCPALRYYNGNTVIYGTPWNGASKKASNLCAPLSAVVILDRSEQNSICSLSADEAIPLLLPRLFLPYYNPALMDKALENAAKIFKSMPIYHLKCRADRNATELVHQCVI
jgi:hypothetical protein